MENVSFQNTKLIPDKSNKLFNDQEINFKINITVKK